MYIEFLTVGKACDRLDLHLY